MTRDLTMLARTALLVLCIAAAWSGDARAQQAPGDAELPARLLAPTRAAIQQLADSLRREGLPHDLLAIKAAEGVLKQASDDRILAAVRALATDLRAARATLGGVPTRGELVAAASALHAGVSPALLQRVASAPPRGSGAAGQGSSLRATAMLVLVDLVSQQVPAATAASAIGTLLESGASERRLLALRDDVAAEVRRGESPTAAASTVLTRLRERRAP